MTTAVAAAARWLLPAACVAAIAVAGHFSRYTWWSFTVGARPPPQPSQQPGNIASSPNSPPYCSETVAAAAAAAVSGSAAADPRPALCPLQRTGRNRAAPAGRRQAAGPHARMVLCEQCRPWSVRPPFQSRPRPQLHFRPRPHPAPAPNIAKVMVGVVVMSCMAQESSLLVRSNREYGSFVYGVGTRASTRRPLRPPTPPPPPPAHRPAAP